MGVVRKITSSGKLSVGLVILLVVVLLGLLHRPLISLIGNRVGHNPHDYSENHWEGVGGKYLLGTDMFGRDVLTLVLEGLWTSLKIGLVAGVLSTVIAIIVAFISAYRGGVLDAVLSTLTDFILVIPTLPLLIAYSAFAENVSLTQIGVIIAIFAWPGAARAIRAQVLSLRTRAYVDLAKVTKMGSFQIILTELAPNMLPYLALGMATAFVNGMFALFGLAVLGLGPGGVVDLGFILNMATSSGALSLEAWGILFAPIVIAVLLFFALTLINLGLEETYNPRLRKVAGT